MYYLYVISIFLCIFQDLPLANVMGDYGRSISGIFAVIVFLFAIFKTKKIYVNKFLKVLLFLLLFLLFYNLATILFFIMSGKEQVFLGENVVNKSVKIFMYYFSNVIYVLSLYQIAKDFPENKILKPFYYIYFLLFIFMLLEFIQLPSAFPFLHATRPEAYNRIRLLTNESSNTTTLILVFFTLALQYAKKFKSKKMFALIILSFLFFIYTTTSKSLFLVLSFGIVVMLMFNKKIKTKYKLLILLLFVISILLLSSSVLEYFVLAKDSSTTLYTRGYTYVVSFLISLKYPFGTSNTLYLNVFVNELKENLQYAYEVIDNFNGLELIYILSTGTDKNISAYSGILQYGMYWGIFGNIIFLTNIFKNVKKTIKSNPILFFGFITIILSVLTTISLDNKYEVWAFLFVLIVYNERGEVTWKK